VEPNFNWDLSGFGSHPEAPMNASAWNDDIIRKSLWGFALCIALHCTIEFSLKRAAQRRIVRPQ
jgi:hypothetical protein